MEAGLRVIGGSFAILVSISSLGRVLHVEITVQHIEFPGVNISGRITVYLQTISKA